MRTPVLLALQRSAPSDDDVSGTHSKYATGQGKKFAIGETGLGYAGSITDRVSWLKQIIAAKSQLSEMTAVSWFNYYKGAWATLPRLLSLEVVRC